MTTIKFNDEIIDINEFECVYYLGQTSILENENLYMDMKNNKNKIYNVLDFYPYLMNIYYMNKYKFLERKLNIQDDKYKYLEKKIYIINTIFLILLLIFIKFI